MADNGNNAVFNRLCLTPNTKDFPNPGEDGHAPILGSDCAWDGNGIKNTSFIRNLPDGQKQELVGSADHVIQVRRNQIVGIQQAQRTTAQQEITITSAENQIHIKAATRIELEVGASKLVMDSDGNITLSGKVITILGDTSTEINAPNNHVCGVTKMDGGDVFVN